MDYPGIDHVKSPNLQRCEAHVASLRCDDNTTYIVVSDGLLPRPLLDKSDSTISCNISTPYNVSLTTHIYASVMLKTRAWNTLLVFNLRFICLPTQTLNTILDVISLQKEEIANYMDVISIKDTNINTFTSQNISLIHRDNAKFTLTLNIAFFKYEGYQSNMLEKHTNVIKDKLHDSEDTIDIPRGKYDSDVWDLQKLNFNITQNCMIFCLSTF